MKNHQKGKDMFKISCNLGVFGYTFFLGSMYTYVYFSGEMLLAVCIYAIIGSVLLTMQYHLLRQLGLKERLFEIILVLIFQAYSMFVKHDNTNIVAVITCIIGVTCVLINHKEGI